MFSGIYSLSKRETRLSDILKMAGGPNQYAYVKGARLERKVNEEERHKLEEAYRMARREQQNNLMETALGSSNAMAIAQLAEKQSKSELEKFQIPDIYPVGIELDKALAHPGSEEDILLREGDRIFVPQYNGTIRINGAVLHPNTVGYKKGKKLSYYIDQAGGYSKSARKKHTYIIYMNGMIARAGAKAKIEPGCEIIVPSKAQGKMTMAEKMAMATSGASLATMAATIANLFK